MKIKEIIGRSISNIYVAVEYEVGGFDKAECFLELNGLLMIDLPWANREEVWIKEHLPDKAEMIGHNLKHIRGRKIMDFLWYPDEEEKGYLLLDNGYLITETTFTNHGTGLAGLNCFDSIDTLVADKGPGLVKLSQMEGTNE